MLPEIGHFALILALCLAIVQGVVPLVGGVLNRARWLNVARSAGYMQALFMIISFLILTALFIRHDFSVIYVARNSNLGLPLEYLISGVWGAHEGSLLLWALILSLWTVAVCLFSKNLPLRFAARGIAVMGLISVGFLLFVICTSNPFERVWPPFSDGGDLNPLLQDFGLIIHPPLLYMGYVGFVVPFAFAVAALLGGGLDAVWIRWVRPWTAIAWAFLTMGIIIGSWWAYYELGWGGWWFWDPVENASLMPWLIGLALIHSLAATEKRGIFKSWTLLLAITAFSLSLLGTFLVRSGVLSSVHAFASDPTRGLFILTFLTIVIGSSLLLYAWRASDIKNTGKFRLLSREAFLLFGNVLVTVATASVLLGTLYPLILDALNLGKISVGSPYFNTVFIPIMTPVMLFLIVGVHVRWKSDNINRLKNTLLVPLAICLVIAVILASIKFSVSVLIGIGIATLIFGSVILDVVRRLRQKRNLPLSFLGMSIAHLGVGIFIIGMTMISQTSMEKDLRMSVGDTATLGEYSFYFKELKELTVDNYDSYMGDIIISKNGEEVVILNPEKRYYKSGSMPMTEAAIDSGIFRDVYVAFGEPLEDGSWTVRLYVKYFVQWLWFGGLFAAVGATIAACDKRYRMRES